MLSQRIKHESVASRQPLPRKRRSQPHHQRLRDEAAQKVFVHSATNNTAHLSRSTTCPPPRTAFSFDAYILRRVSFPTSQQIDVTISVCCIFSTPSPSDRSSSQDCCSASRRLHKREDDWRPSQARPPQPHLEIPNRRARAPSSTSKLSTRTPNLRPRPPHCTAATAPRLHPQAVTPRGPRQQDTFRRICTAK